MSTGQKHQFSRRGQICRIRSGTTENELRLDKVLNVIHYWLCTAIVHYYRPSTNLIRKYQKKFLRVMFKNWEILVRFVDRVWHFDVAERFRVRFFFMTIRRSLCQGWNSSLARTKQKRDFDYWVVFALFLLLGRTFDFLL